MGKEPKQMLYANYHCHTVRCQHAVGSEQSYVEASLQMGYRVLGFSDHTPWRFASNYVSHIRMLPEQLTDYMDTINDLRESYSDRIRIHLGLEAEYFPRYRDWLYEMRDMGITYFILGQHQVGSEEEGSYTPGLCQTDDGVLRYAESCVEAIRTGLYSYIAHPDLFMGNRRHPEEFTPACEEATDMICQACLEADIPLEYNLLGLGDELRGHSRGYPNVPFWTYARKHGCRVIIGVDSHDPAQILNPDTRRIARERLTALDYTIQEVLPMDEDLIR